VPPFKQNRLLKFIFNIQEIEPQQGMPKVWNICQMWYLWRTKSSGCITQPIRDVKVKYRSDSTVNPRVPHIEVQMSSLHMCLALLYDNTHITIAGHPVSSFYAFKVHILQMSKVQGTPWVDTTVLKTYCVSSGSSVSYPSSLLLKKLTKSVPFELRQRKICNLFVFLR
jgi:hypothetical protein